MPERVYLLGPMTGYPDDNRRAFRESAKFLRSVGYEVISPDELDEIEPIKSENWAACLKRDIPWLLAADICVAMPGWRQSRGATLETLNAGELGMPVFELVDKELKPIPRSLLPYPVHPV